MKFPPSVLSSIQNPRFQGLIAFSAGSFLVLAFAPFNLLPLAVICPAVLFIFWRGTTPKRAFLLGWLFGLGLFGFGTYWLYISIHIVGKAPMWLAFFLMLCLISMMAVFPAMVGYLSRKLPPLPGMLSELLVLPALWALLEWVRSWFLTGFPWLSLGYSQINTPLAGYGSVLGVFGISWAVAISAGCLALLSPNRGSGRYRWQVAALVFTLIWLGGALLRKVQWTEPAGKPFKVSLIQGNVPEASKWLPETLGPQLDLYRNLTEKNWSSKLIIWPEAALPVFYDEVANTYLQDLEDEAKKHGSTILLGIDVYHPEKDEYFNSVVSVGEQREFYFKRHLVPFGEFFPVPKSVRRWLRLMNLPYSDFTAGPAQQPLMRTNGYPVGVSICYEDAFGGLIAKDLPDAAFLVNVSNDGWFGESIALAQHLQIASMRALETGRYLVRDTNTGITAIISPKGRVVARLPMDKEAVLTAELQPYQGETLYVKIGNTLLVISILLVYGLSWMVVFLLKKKMR